jgi:hypothetical protein
MVSIRKAIHQRTRIALLPTEVVDDRLPIVQQHFRVEDFQGKTKLMGELTTVCKE